jgi:mRNA interferase MazF
MVNKAMPEKRSILRGEVYWVNLDPTVGSEIQKTRPAVIVSPDDMNAALPRVIIAPLTSAGQPMGCRPELVFQKKPARILLDQLPHKKNGLDQNRNLASCFAGNAGLRSGLLTTKFVIPLRDIGEHATTHLV